MFNRTNICKADLTRNHIYYGLRDYKCSTLILLIIQLINSKVTAVKEIHRNHSAWQLGRLQVPTCLLWILLRSSLFVLHTVILPFFFLRSQAYIDVQGNKSDIFFSTLICWVIANVIFIKQKEVEIWLKNINLKEITINWRINQIWTLRRGVLLHAFYK